MQKLCAGTTLGVLVLASGLISCDSASITDKILSTKETVPAVPGSKASSSPYKPLEQSIHQQINRYRQARKLPPLTLDPRISEQARRTVKQWRVVKFHLAIKDLNSESKLFAV